ncbi:hypothetical protein PCANC_06248 [Puccinia coronata f. sp. avenae]|uniref:Uncharacterized protein n=1 Tax=Puccinia coronata f. sp. avenae TaxID=200324 RepID=A0A2N5V389_9BASI|nr:hypothetical protein PCANC_12859 [Puccinia coronata f. sp. avenae]PLW37841.1 hypothetical protein PCASD_05721 [Puccinia coronata f. sp. avenae]PLW44475.1 hypothetical protein PCANC_06248 [Puccinia coronata f. sp. avenae]
MHSPLYVLSLVPLVNTAFRNGTIHGENSQVTIRSWESTVCSKSAKMPQASTGVTMNGALHKDSKHGKSNVGAPWYNTGL